MPSKKPTKPTPGEQVVADVNIHYDGRIYYAGWPHLEQALPASMVEDLLATGGAHTEKVSG